MCRSPIAIVVAIVVATEASNKKAPELLLPVVASHSANTKLSTKVHPNTSNPKWICVSMDYAVDTSIVNSPVPTNMWVDYMFLSRDL